MIRVEAGQSAQAINTVVRGFRDDVMAKALRIPEHLLTRMFVLPVKLGFTYGEVYGSSEALEGVMVMVPGERSHFGIKEVVGSRSVGAALGMLRLFLNKHMRKMFTILDTDHKSLDIGPYWYLAVIAVAPEHQGKGHGGRLLRFLCSRADEENRAIYLETQTSSNVELYRHFGFEVIKHVEITNELAMWEMVRPAASSRE